MRSNPIVACPFCCALRERESNGSFPAANLCAMQTCGRMMSIEFIPCGRGSQRKWRGLKARAEDTQSAGRELFLGDLNLFCLSVAVGQRELHLANLRAWPR